MTRAEVATYPNVVVGDDSQDAQIVTGEGVELLDVEAGAAVPMTIDNEATGVREGGPDGVAPALWIELVSMGVAPKRRR